MNQNSSIKEKVMLANLNISIWTGRALDNTATKNVETSFDKSGIGRFNKILMPQKPESFEKIKRIHTRLRKEYLAQTLAYDKQNIRLMTTGIYLDWTAHIRATIEEFDDAVQAFLYLYDDIKEESRIKLGKLYDEFDYPNVPNLRTKFGIDFCVWPFPQAEHFGVDLPEENVRIIKEDLDKNMQRAVDFACSDLSSRLYEATLKLAQRASSDGKFHSSAIENLREIISILPKLNFTNDVRLTELANKADKELTAFSADALRSSPHIRSEIAAKATAIAQDMSEYMGLPFDMSLIDGDDQPRSRLELLAA